MSGSTSENRLRTHPDERFAGAGHKIDLAEATAALRAEGTPGVRGHHQKTLYHRGASTLALFAFDRGGRLAEHKAAGTVIIQAVDGKLTVKAGGETHDLSAGQLLVLAPGVKHDVTAEEPSRMLLTVQLDPAPIA